MNTFKARLLNAWKSRTVRFAVLLALFSIVQQNLWIVRDHMTPTAYTEVLFAVSVAMVALRFITTTPLEHR